MKKGDLVKFYDYSTFEFPHELAMIINEIPYEERGNDPFPHYHVLFPLRGEILHCRGSDLILVNDETW